MLIVETIGRIRRAYHIEKRNITLEHRRRS
jgi:hypothetical protein